MKLDETIRCINIFKKIGFSEIQISTLIKKSDLYDDCFSILESSYAFYHKNMIARGYNEIEIHALATAYPLAMFSKFTKMILKKQYISFLEQLDLEREIENATYASDFDLEKNVRMLELIGIEKNKIEEMFKNKCEILFLKSKELSANINFYLGLGMLKKELAKNVKTMPNILLYGKEYYQEVLDFLPVFNLKKKEFVNFINVLVHKRRYLNVPNFISILKWAQTKKFDLNKIGLKIFHSYHYMDGNVEYYEKSYQKFIRLGFSDEQICSILTNCIQVLSLDEDMMAYKMNLLVLFGISEENVFEFIRECPYYLSISVDGIVERFRIIRDYLLLDGIINHPSNFIFNAENMELRAKYLTKCYDFIDPISYARQVFCTEAKFIQKYNISTEEIKKMLLTDKS